MIRYFAIVVINGEQGSEGWARQVCEVFRFRDWLAGSRILLRVCARMRVCHMHAVSVREAFMRVQMFLESKYHVGAE